MNYFAHGYRFVDTPYFMVGTSVPDWLNVLNRKAKARAKTAQGWVTQEDPRTADIARGVIQHHHDDGWFHATRPFAELSMQFSIGIREILGNDRGFRAGFLGHILVELLLDATLIEDDPSKLDAYYAAFDQVDTEWVSKVVNQMTTQPVPSMAQLIPRFRQEGFLYDYLDDDRLLYRLNQVMRRVKLAAIPESFCDFLPAAREIVRERQQELLQEPTSS